MLTIDLKSRAKYAFARFAVLAGLVLLAALLGGCSTLNSAGIGGEPRVRCDATTGDAFLSDPLVGASDQAKLAVDRRLKAADSICAAFALERAKTQAGLIVQRRVLDQLLRSAEEVPIPRGLTPNDL